MRFVCLIVFATILTACGVLRPFGNSAVYQSYYASAQTGLEGHYICMRNLLNAAGYDVETIIPERDSPNFFDIEKGGELIAQIDMYQLTGEKGISITLIAGSKQTSADIDRTIASCVNN